MDLIFTRKALDFILRSQKRYKAIAINVVLMMAQAPPLIVILVLNEGAETCTCNLQHTIHRGQCTTIDLKSIMTCNLPTYTCAQVEWAKKKNASKR